MDAEAPQPLTPADCDLREYPFMPLEVKRLLTSETWILGTGDERAAAIALWLESWHQVPAASLPDNDRMLAHLSQSKQWKKVKEHALRGWQLCADGKLYHPVVAEKALEGWIGKLVSSLSGSTGNAKRWGIQVDTEAVRAQIIDAVNRLHAIAPQSEMLRKTQVRNIVAGSPPDKKKIAPRSKKESPPESPPDRNREGEGEGDKAEPIGSGAAAPQLTPADALFQVAVPWLVDRGVADKTARSLLGGARKQLGDEGAWNLASECIRLAPLEPTAWLAGALNQRMRRGVVRANGSHLNNDDENARAKELLFGNESEVIDG